MWKAATREVKSDEAEIDDFLHEAAKIKIRITPLEEIFSEKKSAKKTCEGVSARQSQCHGWREFSEVAAGQAEN